MTRSRSTAVLRRLLAGGVVTGLAAGLALVGPAGGAHAGGPQARLENFN